MLFVVVVSEEEQVIDRGRERETTNYITLKEYGQKFQGLFFSRSKRGGCLLLSFSFLDFFGDSVLFGRRKKTGSRRRLVTGRFLEGRCFSVDDTLILAIVLVVKVVKHDPKEDCMSHERVSKHGLITTIYVERKAGMDECDHKLDLRRRDNQGKTTLILSDIKYSLQSYHLHYRQILLPPEILPDLRTQSSQTVIGVHDHVDSAVDEGKEGIVSSSSELESYPDSPGNKRVMHDMESRDVCELFPQHKEHRV